MSPHVTLLPAPDDAGPLTSIAASSSATNVAGALELARELGRTAHATGPGSTRDLWEALATIAARDLGVARAVEPHLDALAILSQAGASLADVDGSTWGVFAAEGGDDPLTAARLGDHWTLTGTKPWCSLADRLDRALVTAHLPRGERGLFAVDLRAVGVAIVPGQWHARGLVEIPSGPITFLDTFADPVGEPGWYLSRPGFAWGGIGVAACWYGGAVGLARSLFERAGSEPDLLTAAHLGAVDEQLQSARRALAEAAAIIDGTEDATDPSLLAKRVRAVVVRACEATLLHAAHALGPAPLALDEDYAKRVADLQLYIRQHHAEKDDASLGAALARREVAPW
jgi:alkylation response protein AidB-like acyl-CoA dehydrogenase